MDYNSEASSTELFNIILTNVEKLRPPQLIIMNPTKLAQLLSCSSAQLKSNLDSSEAGWEAVSVAFSFMFLSQTA